MSTFNPASEHGASATRNGTAKTDWSALKAELKSRLRLEEQVAADGYDLKLEGRNMVGISPFRYEKTPSFKIEIDKQFYWDFGSDESGDIFDWIAFVLKKTCVGGDFITVLKECSKRAGIAFPGQDAPCTPTGKKALPVRTATVAVAEKPRKVYSTQAALNAAMDRMAKGKGKAWFMLCMNTNVVGFLNSSSIAITFL